MKNVLFPSSNSLTPCTGATVTEWLISKGKARNSPEALVLAAGLMNEGFLQPADELSKEAAESGEQTVFLADTNALYYFVSSNACGKTYYLTMALSIHTCFGNSSFFHVFSLFVCT